MAKNKAEKNGIEIKFLIAETVFDHNKEVEQQFEKGEIVELNEASANYWINKGSALPVADAIALEKAKKEELQNVDPADDLVGLIGSASLANEIEIGERTYQAGEIIRGAFELSAMDAEDWNALADAGRDVFIGEYIDTLGG